MPRDLDTADTDPNLGVLDVVCVDAAEVLADAGFVKGLEASGYRLQRNPHGQPRVFPPDGEHPTSFCVFLRPVTKGVLRAG